MRRLPALLILLFAWSATVQAQDLNRLKVTAYTVKNGLANNLTWALATDRHGFVWVSHQEGVSRFDGVNFTNYGEKPGDPHSYKTGYNPSFALDHLGRLWVANSKGLGWYDEVNDRFQYVVLPDSSGTNFSNHIAFDGQQLWLAGDKGLYRLDLQTLKISETPVKDYLNYVVCDRRQGYVWIPVLLRGIYRFHPASGEVRFFPRKGNLNGLYAAPDGDVWITEADSLVHLDVETGRFEAFSAGPFFKRNMRNITAFNLTTFPPLTGEQVLWIPTDGNGIVLFDLAQKRFIDQISPSILSPNGLSTPFPVGAFYWGGSVLWLTSDQGGLLKIDLNDQQFQPVVFPFLLESSNRNIAKILPDRQDPGIWWVAQAENGLLRYDTRTRRVLRHYFNQPGVLTENTISDLVYDQQGRLWLATKNGPAIFEPDNGSLRFPAGLPEEPEAVSIELFGADEIWFLQRRGVGRYEVGGERYTHFSLENDPARTRFVLVRDLTVLHDGTVLVSHNYRISKIDRATGVELFYENKPPAGAPMVPHEMAEDAQGRLWIGGVGELCRYDRGTKTAKFYDQTNGFAKTLCSQLFFDTRGFLWLFTLNGLCRMDTEKETFTWYKELPGQTLNRNFLAMNRGRSYFDGAYFFTQAHANFRFDPLLVDQNDAPARPLVAQFRVRGKALPFSPETVAEKPLALDYGQNFLAFDFTALNFTQSERMRFRYILESFEDDWTETDRVRTVNYTNVPPGDYTFKVLAANSAGVWNEQPAVFKITINPPWWATWWFRLLALAAVALAGYTFFQSRVKKIRRQAEIREREAGYKQREAELQREVAEFSKQVAEVELAALRAQMNPHFVFNCLNSINTFILLNDPKNASGYLQKFSKLIRRVLDASRAEYITLREELDTLRYYIELEVMRYGNRFAYQITTAETLDLDAFDLPPMLVQPYVENAIWHGLMHREGNDGLLKIDVSKEDKALKIIVEDNGIGRNAAATLRSKTATHHKSHGMDVTHERIKIINELYGIEATVTVEDLFDERGNAKGTRVVLRLPMKENG